MPKRKGFKLPTSIFPFTTRAAAERGIAKLRLKFPAIKFKIRRKGTIYNIWGYK